MSLKRRQLLLGSTLALGACSAADGDGARRFRWTMVTAWPAGFAGLGTAAQRLADRIGAASGGRLRVDVHGGGELVGPFDVFDAVSRGTAQMGHSAAHFWQAKSAAAPFFGTVPFGLNAQESAAWLEHGGLALWQELYARFDLVPFAVGNTGVQLAGWFNREILGVDDLRGLRMRIPGLGGDVLARLGATPVNVPGAGMYSALESGALDACEWMGPFNDLALGLFRVAKYCYYPGWQEPGSTIECLIHRPAWLALPADLRAIVEACCAAEQAQLLADYTARNATALRTLVEDHRVELRRLPDSVLQALRATTATVLDALVAHDPFARRVYDAQCAFRDAARAWHAVSEVPYYQASA
jgi:TRAP-type mannitol/chloroaromatic compound transport system substrate-binding protein